MPQRKKLLPRLMSGVTYHSIITKTGHARLLCVKTLNLSFVEFLTPFPSSLSLDNFGRGKPNFMSLPLKMD